MSFVSGPTITPDFTSGAAAAGWTLSVAADTSLASLDIRGGGAGTGDKPVRWDASISSLEIGAPTT
jgi:hypothetical protein